MHPKLLAALCLLCLAAGAPVPPGENRHQKALSFYDYAPSDVDYENYVPETGDEDDASVEDDDYVGLGLDENAIGRTVPQRKRIRDRPPFNSPVYYIRLPPQPYMFVPGLGYVSQPPPPSMSQFVNVPVSFVANGKPSAIYQWGGGLQGFPTAAPPPPPVVSRPKPPPKPATDSAVHRLPGKYTFNGKPNDIFVLRDSYNSLYGDVLQNFYP